MIHLLRIQKWHQNLENNANFKKKTSSRQTLCIILMSRKPVPKLCGVGVYDWYSIFFLATLIWIKKQWVKNYNEQFLSMKALRSTKNSENIRPRVRLQGKATSSYTILKMKDLIFFSLIADKLDANKNLICL